MIKIKNIIERLNNPNEYGLYKYDSYQQYKNAQIKANMNCINNVWVEKKEINFLSNYIKKLNINPKFILCHGTRNGKEQEYFLNNFKNVKVLGTEISPTAKDFPNTIEWDFHKTKKEWVNNVDVIYSNSLDHSYKPLECLKTWVSCLNDNGILIIEWSSNAQHKNITDPFSISLNKLKKLIKNNFILVNVLSSPINLNIVKRVKSLNQKKYFLVVKNEE